MDNSILIAVLFVGTSSRPAFTKDAQVRLASTDGEATLIARHVNLNLDRRGDHVQLDRRVWRAIGTIWGNNGTSRSFQQDEIAPCRSRAHSNTDSRLMRVPQHIRSTAVGAQHLILGDGE